MQPFSRERIYGLDILRAAAILLAMFSHSMDFLEPHFNVSLLRIAIPDGVTVFFVLSGFLVGGILLRDMGQGQGQGQGGFSLKAFWIRRWFRTLPAYFIVLAVMAMLSQFISGQWPEQLWQYATFTQNWAWRHPGFFPEAWSLAVEEWFYLLLPLVFWGLIRLFRLRSPGSILGLILLLILALTFYRSYRTLELAVLPGFDWGEGVRKQVITRLDSILYGVLGACLAQYYPQAWNRRKGLLLVIGLLLCFGSRAMMLTRNVDFLFHGYLLTSSLGVLCLLPFLSNIRTGKGLVFEALSFIALISYSLYLLNYTLVSKTLLPWWYAWSGMQLAESGGNALLAMGLFWVGSVGLAAVLYWMVERRFIRR